MSFVLTAVSTGVAADHAPSVSSDSFVLEPARQGDGAASRAGYLPGAERHLGRAVSGFALYVFLEDDDGYRTSGALFPYPDDDDEPVRMAVPEEYREELHRILEALLHASPDHEVILIAEYNGSVTDPSETGVEVDILGPWDLQAFWTHHDLGEIIEESIIVLRDAR